MLRNPDAGARGKQHPSIDAVGVALLAAGPSLLVYFLSEGDRYDWFNDANLVLACVAGALTTIAFIFWELYGTTAPIVDLRIFKFRRVAIGSVLAVGNAFVYLSTMVFLPQYAQNVLGYTPTQSGVLVLMRTVLATIFVPIAGSLASRVDVRLLIGGGFLGMAIGGYWQSQVMTPGTDFHALLFPLMVAGIANAFTFSPLFVAIIGGVPHSERAKAAAITSVTIQLGGALATAVLITSLHVRTAFHQDVLSSGMTSNHLAVVEYVHRFGAAALNTLVEGQSVAFAYADVAVMIAIVAVLTAPIAALLGGRD
jgi:DHA2 family multidrug resistance protein